MTGVRYDVKAMEMQLPPVSNAFHCSAYKMAMSHRREKNSLFQRSLIGMDGLYEVTFYERDLGLRLDVNANGDITVHTIKVTPALPPKSTRSVATTPRPPTSNADLLVPGDILVSVGCIGVRHSDKVSLTEVAELIQVQARPIRLVFESQVARALQVQLRDTLSRLVFSPLLAAHFDVGASTRDLVFQTSLEMVVDFSYSLYAWFDPLRVVHVILFDDVLLVTEARDKGKPRSKLVVKHLFPLQLLHVRDLMASTDYIPSSLELVHPSKTFTFIARDERAKKEALDAFGMALALASNANPSARGWQYQFATGSVHQCALRGNLKGIELLASRCADLDEQDVNGWTALFYAAVRNHVKVVRLLARLGANVNVVDEFGLGALHYACLYQCPSSVDALLDAGAMAEARDVYGRSPLFLCAINEDPLLCAPLPVDVRAMRLCMELLITAGAALETTDNEGLSALEHNLCVNVAKCRVLLDVGMRLDTLYEGANSILHLACDSGSMAVNYDLLSLLLEYGAQPNAVNADGNTPLHLLCLQYICDRDAAQFQVDAIVLRAMELLVAHGARFNLMNANGTSVEMLLEAHQIPISIGKALVLWQSKRRILASPRVLSRADGPKQEQIVLLQMPTAPTPPTKCGICHWQCEWTPSSTFFEATGSSPLWDAPSTRLVGLYNCSVCLTPVCGLCSLKHLGVYHVHTSTYLDLPPSLQTKPVCDGCYNFAFYDLAREVAASTTEMPPLSSRRRPRTRSLQGLRLL
ncbi:hypothetical protein SPRG_04671 [Saprolegnia parasitica CBS 223.65]|uniref:Uncharacterized protein n=1 Tax=Saprolegnia parasitica (strain CBS 223.65) TaxID=695850 RepID=A0A067CNG8_SAPPC|nr:hypothetical protein SPRG_04671 [Saprolegnia parasitica CBS 223.65]KDO30770.1 hypothetical protein SPRG_04671 [Saprolegnia parasitica CBS 223.65]|eukprot:XP_012198469.1 hypothetical protein SPRG_04671 [Saprolegnia parasitica CBS 223.65]